MQQYKHANWNRNNGWIKSDNAWQLSVCTLIVNSHKNDKYPKHNRKHVEYSHGEKALLTTKWNAIYVPSQLFNSHFYKTTLITNAIDKSVRFLNRQA